jgi:hypothetical protein
MDIVIDQPFGIGDILFLSPLIRRLEYNHAIWPVVDHYYWIKDYLEIPGLTYTKQSQFRKDGYSDYTIIPFQHAHSLVSSAEDCMEAKYKLFNADLELWRELVFTRNYEKERELELLLGIKETDRFVFVNNNFAGPEYNYKLNIKPSTSLRVVEQQYISGFTLLDWCGVLEKATEIHTVSTALFFVIESLRLENNLHLYPRKPLDKDLSPIKTLISKKWTCYE